MADEVENVVQDVEKEVKAVEADAIELEARAAGLTRDEFVKLRADIHRMWNPASGVTLRGNQPQAVEAPKPEEPAAE